MPPFVFGQRSGEPFRLGFAIHREGAYNHIIVDVFTFMPCRFTATAESKPVVTHSSILALLHPRPIHLLSPLRRCVCFLKSVLLTGTSLALLGCPPDDSPLREENQRLQKQIVKQESVLDSLQEGNKVMQQQIDLLNQEFRDKKQEGDQELQAVQQTNNILTRERKKLTSKIESLEKGNRKLTADVDWLRRQRAQIRKTLHVEDEDTQSEELLHSFLIVFKAVDEALARNGYAIKASMATDQKGAYVTERKVSAPTSLELSGFRNQYVVIVEKLGQGKTKVSVKADFEKIGERGAILEANQDEMSEIELRLLNEVRRSLEGSGKA